MKKLLFISLLFAFIASACEPMSSSGSDTTFVDSTTTITEIPTTSINTSAATSSVSSESSVSVDPLVEANKAVAIDNLNRHYLRANYADYEWGLITAIIAQATIDINNAKTIAEIASVSTAAYAAIDKIPTIAVKEMQATAILGLEAYVNEEEYTEEGLATIRGYLDAARDLILQATNSAAINAICYNTRALIDAVPIDPVLARKREAIEELRNYVSEEDYSPANWTLISATIDASIIGINGLADIYTINVYLAAQKSIIDSVPTIEVEQARLDAKDELDAYVLEESYYQSDWLTVLDYINTAKGQIDLALSFDAIDDIVADAMALIDLVPVNPIPSARFNAIRQLESYVMEAHYEAADWVTVLDIITTARNNINQSEDEEEILNLLASAKTAIDDVPKKVTPVGEALSVNFIDIGQGDGSIHLLPNGQVLAIDTGKSTTNKAMINFLNNHDIDTIDFYVLSHMDTDHINNFFNMADSFIIKSVYYSHGVKEISKTEIAVVEKIEKICQGKIGCNNGFSTINLEIRDLVNIPNLKVQVSGPSNLSSKNNSSTLTKIEYYDSSFLFIGDCEEKCEDAFVAEAAKTPAMAAFLKADVYKAGHHGSHTSSHENFLDVVLPSYTVIQCGTGNTYGHPHQEALDRILKYVDPQNIYRNDLHGSVEFVTTGSGYQIYTEKTV